MSTTTEFNTEFNQEASLELAQETQALQRMQSAPPTLAGVNIEALLAKAVDANSAVDVLERLAVMRREMKAESAKEAFDRALAAFQAECPVIKKDSGVHDKSGKMRYRYAPLDSIVGQTKELLRRHGFSYSMTAKVEDKWVTAVILAKHEAGHSEQSEFKVPIDPDAYMNAAQKFASALTFAKRYCLHPSTLTLDANLDWKPLSEISVGDQLFAFDEFTEDTKRRRYRITTVTSIKRVKLPSRIITLEDGRTIISSNDHLWLSGRPRGSRVLATVCDVCGRKFESPRSRGLHRRMAHGIIKDGNGWVRTENIGPGSILRDFGPPWKRDHDYQAGYLAGVFDGEASLLPKVDGLRGFAILFSQKPGRVMDQTYAFLKSKNFLIRYGSHKNGVHTLHICGGYDSIRFLSQIRPVRLYAKARPWIDGAGCRNKIGPGPIRVISCEGIGEQELISIETTTGTLFAEGLYSHNCFCNAFGILTGDWDDDAQGSDPEHAAGQGKRTPPQPAPGPAAARAPAATPAASSALAKLPTAKFRERAIEKLITSPAHYKVLLEFLQKAGALMPNETDLKLWPLQHVPASETELEALRKALAGFESGEPAKIPFYHQEAMLSDVAQPELLRAAPAKTKKPVEVPRDPDAGEQGTVPTAIDPNWECATGEIERVSVKNGSGRRGAWTLFGIKIGQEWYNTFDKTIGKLAQANEHRGVDLYYSANEKGKTAEHIEA